MRNQTEMMRAILTNEKAQEIIDYVSPRYGNSYVALWIFQAMGIVLGEIYDIANKLRSETSPATADLLLDYWENHYAIPKDSSLTKEQRNLRLISKTSVRGPANPKRLEAAVSAALGGVKVEITENIAKNTFLVNVREVVGDITPAIAVLERMKQTHLIYQIQVATQTIAEADLKVAIALTHSEKNKVMVQSPDIPNQVLSLDASGTLVASVSPTLLEDGTLVYTPTLRLLDDGVLSV